MALFANPFRKKPPRDEAALARVRAWTAAALGNPPGLDLTISEVECADPAAPALKPSSLCCAKARQRRP